MRQLGKPWLDAFMEYCDEMETPKEWLRWAGLSTLSSSIKRNCYLWYRKIKFFPNQYIILVGPPGIGKGEAISRGYDLAFNAKTCNYIKDWHTPQEILEELAEGFQGIGLKVGQVITAQVIKDHTCTIIAPELAVFLQNYENLHSLLCAWWDQNKFEYKTKNKGKHTVEDMSVSLLGGCVPDYIRSLSKDRMAPITGGFTARTIFVYAIEKDHLNKYSFGAPTPINSKLRDALIHDLKHIQSLTGELTVSKEAQKLWEDVYEEHNKRGAIDSDASQNFKSRISSHIIKTTITVCLSATDSLTITRDHLDTAIRYIEEIRDKVDVVFRSVGESPLSVIQNKVLTIIDGIGMISHKALLKHMYRDATDDQLNMVLTMLDKVGLIKTNTNSQGFVEYESMNQVKIPQGAGGP